MRVLYLVNIPSPYRVDFFNELGKFCNLDVLFEKNFSSERNEAWFVDNYKNFNAIFLKKYKLLRKHVLCIDVIKYLMNKKYDIIVIGGYSTLTGMLSILTLRLLKKKYILNADGGIIKEDNFIIRKVKRFFIKNATFYLSTGLECNKYLEYYGAQSDKLFIYPFSTLYQDEILKQPLSKEKKIYYKKLLDVKEEKIILAVGQFINRKGFDILLKSCEGLNENYGLYLIGGKVTEEYLKIVQDYNLKNVYFLDFNKKNDLKKYYKAADLFVLPTREDIWGLVINEAMSYGLPVITSNKCIAGLELIKEGYNGYITSVENIDELKHVLHKLLESDTYDLSKNTLKIIGNYSIQNMAKTHFDIFNKFIKQNK